MMAESRQRADWWHTAALLATIQNVFSSRKVTARECHPMERRKPMLVIEGKGLRILKDVFCQPEPKKSGGA